MIIHRRADSHTVMPWANGGGRTAEVAIFPPDASIAARNFAWRISMADVAGDGPFSALAGFDRNLTLIAGAGMVLDAGANGLMDLSGPYDQAAFPGDWPIEARLKAGPIRDLNVMTRRGVATATVDIVRVGAPHRLASTRDARVLLVLDGRLSAAALGPDLRHFDLIRHDALLCAGGADAGIALDGAPAGVIAVVTLREMA